MKYQHNYVIMSNLIAKGTSLHNLEQNINLDLPILVQWLQTNRLSLNLTKKHIMLFGKGGNSNINVNIEGVPINIVKETKFLGILLDNRLTWKSHTAYISKKIAKSIGILSRARKLLNRETLRQLYFAFLYPYLNYCLIIWGNAPATTTFPIFKLQKRALRIVFNLKGRDSTQVACRNSKLLRLPELYTLSVLTFMYKFKNHLLPVIFNNFYQENSSFHRYPTRQSANLRNPRT